MFVGRPIASNDRRALEHVARYLLRAPVSLERMRYDPQNARVTIRPLPGDQEDPKTLVPGPGVEPGRD